MMHQASVRVHHNPDNSPYSIGQPQTTNTMPLGTNGPSAYPNVSSAGSNMNCTQEVNTLSEELRAAVEDCQVLYFTSCNTTLF